MSIKLANITFHMASNRKLQKKTSNLILYWEEGDEMGWDTDTLAPLQIQTKPAEIKTHSES